MARRQLTGMIIFGMFERAIEMDRISKAGQPYKSRMYVLNVKFTNKKQDSLFINLPKDVDFANLQEGQVYGFPVIHREPYKQGAKTSFLARDDAEPFAAPHLETDI
ncbi:MAG: hypothetical protein ABL901_00935 [Hyphomicrobiaceae bacterium]